MNKLYDHFTDPFANYSGFDGMGADGKPLFGPLTPATRKRTKKEEELDKELDAMMNAASDCPQKPRQSEWEQSVKSRLAGFPIRDVSKLIVVDAPLERLRAVVQKVAEGECYWSIREEYCSLSLLLNMEGLLAPAFRPPVVPRKKWGDDVYMDIYRDQLVIDCHWLHCTKQSVSLKPKDIYWSPLFYRLTPFPFNLAWDFARENWGANHRAVEMFRLTDFQQFQLMALRGDHVKKIVDSIDKPERRGRGVKTGPSQHSLFVQGMNAWCERDCRMEAHRDGYTAVWRARAYLGPAASVRQVGKLAALMLGEKPKDDKTIRTRQENIRRHILGAS